MRIVLITLLFCASLNAQTAYVAVGDSITDGVGRCDVTLESQRWYNQANALSWFVANPGTWHQSASSGWKVADAISNYWAVDDYKPNGTSITEAYVFVYLGTNDLGSGGLSADTVRANLRTYWSTARADGFKIVAMTVVPNAIDFNTEAKNTQRLLLNTYIKADSAYYDKLVDLAADPTMGAITTSSAAWNATYACDGTHLTIAGLGAFAAAVNKTMPGGLFPLPSPVAR